MSNSKTIPYPGARIHIVYTRELPHPNQAEVGKTEKMSAGGSHKKENVQYQGPIRRYSW